MNVADEARMTEEYLTVISLIGRLHRQFLENVKLELDGADIRERLIPMRPGPPLAVAKSVS